MRLLIWWLLPCFILKTAREVLRILYVQHNSRWISIAISVPLTLSWTYVSTISLSASILFHLLCNLQFIHFDDYVKLLERESDVMVFIEEHIRLRYHLSKISHRFRIFLLLQFLVVTVSQVVTLFQTTVYSGMIDFSNGSDFAVSCEYLFLCSSNVQSVTFTNLLNEKTEVANLNGNFPEILLISWHIFFRV